MCSQHCHNSEADFSTNYEELLSFAWYNEFRDTIQIRLIENGQAIKHFAMDDPLLPALLIREQMWQTVKQNPAPGTSSHSSPDLGKVTKVKKPVRKYQTLKDPCKKRGRKAGRSSSQAFKDHEPKAFNWGARKSRRERKLGNSTPKRPLSSFMLFLNENRRAIVESLEPGSRLMAISKRAGDLWRTMPLEEVQKYRSVARANMDCWNKQIEALKDKNRNCSVKTEGEAEIHNSVPINQEIKTGSEISFKLSSVKDLNILEVHQDGSVSQQETNNHEDIFSEATVISLDI